jgi:hypothetical protein
LVLARGIVADSGLSDDVRQFIEWSLDSVEQLEVLLLLKSRPETSWDAKSVASLLGLLPGTAAKCLEDLGTRNLLDVRIADRLRFRYAPGTGRLAETVDGLAKAYAEQRVLVLELLMAKPQRPIRDFLDAFRIRKEEKQDG